MREREREGENATTKGTIVSTGSLPKPGAGISVQVSHLVAGIQLLQFLSLPGIVCPSRKLKSGARSGAGVQALLRGPQVAVKLWRANSCSLFLSWGSRNHTAEAVIVTDICRVSVG